MFNDEEWAGPGADEAYWALMPAETPGDPSPADCLVQELLEARVNIKSEGNDNDYCNGYLAGRVQSIEELLEARVNIKSEGNDNDCCNGYLAGRVQSIDLSLRIVLRRLDVSPRQRYIAEHVLGQTAKP